MRTLVVDRRLFMGGMLLFPAVAAACGGQPRTAVPADPGSPAGGGGRPSDKDWDAFDGHLRGLAEAGMFSGAVLVAGNGQPLLRRGYGMADRARGVANTAGARFCIASMGKMFTAVAVAQLVGRGALSFDDTVGKHVPGFPAEIADAVTIHHLLTHTSGMGDVLRFAPPADPAPTLTDLVRQIAAEPLRFRPGSGFAYSNSGFIVLGAVIEHVTGNDYAAHVREHVFEPAGMTDTADLVQFGNPSGGAYSTVDDMLRFAEALTSHRLLDQPLTDTVLAGKVDTDRPGGPPEDRYAYGFTDQRINGVRIVGHNGGNPGHEAQLDIYPDLAHVVVILTSQDGVLLPAIRRSQKILTT